MKSYEYHDSLIRENQEPNTQNRIPFLFVIAILIFSLCVNIILYKDSAAKAQTINELKTETYDQKKKNDDLQKKIDTYYSKQTNASLYLKELGYSEEEIDVVINSIASPFLESTVIKEKIANGESLTEREQIIKYLIVK